MKPLFFDSLPVIFLTILLFLIMTHVRSLFSTDEEFVFLKKNRNIFLKVSIGFIFCKFIFTRTFDDAFSNPSLTNISVISTILSGVGFFVLAFAGLLCFLSIFSSVRKVTEDIDEKE